MINDKKGAIGLKDAPSLIIIVGFIFILMATVAYVSEEYRDGIGASLDGTVANETGFYLNGTTYTVDSATACNFRDFAVTSILNVTDNSTIGVGNVTQSATAGTIVNASADIDGAYQVKISYTYSYAGVACNVTEDLETELASNTSIAGIILTISLVGIVLSILIGIFLGFKGSRF